MRRKVTKAVAYLRTSSAANVGAEKDSHHRQLKAIADFAKEEGFEVVDSFYDAAVSGADPVDARPGFAAMLDRIASNGVGTILVETANRFSRDLVVQETGFAYLRAQGIKLIAADNPESFVEDTPTAVMVRQILGAVSEFEKASLVAKLKAARDRKRAKMGKCEGRKSLQQTAPAAVQLARRLRRKKPKGGRMSLRAIAKKLAAKGHLNEKGRPYSARAVLVMVS